MGGGEKHHEGGVMGSGIRGNRIIKAAGANQKLQGQKSKRFRLVAGEGTGSDINNHQHQNKSSRTKNKTLQNSLVNTNFNGGVLLQPSVKNGKAKGFKPEDSFPKPGERLYNERSSSIMLNSLGGINRRGGRGKC